MKEWLVCTLTLTVWVAAISTASAQSGPPGSTTGPTVWDGVFSDDQAERGQEAYGTFCSTCHLGDLSGYNDVLKGDHFMSRWREDTLESLFLNIRNTMPRGAPGSLTEVMYLDIVAYLLRENGFPVGDAELGSEALTRITVIAREGPGALPPGAMVQTYGCLTMLPDETWVLSGATLPVRTRNPASSSDEELELASAAPSGERTLRLMDARFYGAASHKDQRVEAKGFLVTEPTEGIAVTSLAVISPVCS